MQGLFSFMASAAGRLIRIIAGIALIAWGVYGMGATTNGLIVAAIGAVPMLTGLLNICLFAPLFGYSLSGSKVRKQA